MPDVIMRTLGRAIEFDDEVAEHSVVIRAESGPLELIVTGERGSVYRLTEEQERAVWALLASRNA